MRHWHFRTRKSLSLHVAIIGLFALTPVRAADAVARLLDSLDQDDEYLIVWVVSSDRTQELWVEDLSSTTRWSETVGSNPTATLYAEKNRSFLVQFAIEIEHVPLCLVLDPSGREVGRARVGNLTKDAFGTLSSRLADLLMAAEASRQHGNGAAVRDGDSSALFWLGYFHWSRGERYKALRLFEEYTALPRTVNGADSQLQARALYRQGEHALEAGQNQKAAALFARGLNLTQSPEHAARCALARAGSLRRLGQSDQAIECIESQLRTRPPSRLQDRLLFCLGYLYLDLGQREKARKAFTECTTNFPASAYSLKSAHYLRELNASATLRSVKGL